MVAIQEITLGALRRSDKPKVTVDILKHLYFDEKLSLREIGKRLDRHMSTILDYFVRYGIERRSISEARRLLAENLNKDKAEIIGKIIELYQLGDGQGTIAKKLNVTEGYIHWHLIRNGIEIRKQSDAQKLGYARGNIPKPMFGLKGELCPNFKGGSYTEKGGYKLLLIPQHYKADSRGYVREHVLIWEKVHNRKLPEGYHIHHINGIKNDNRPINLIALSKKTHDRLIPELKKRIRQLEQEVKLLEKTLDNSQMLFKMEDN